MYPEIFIPPELVKPAEPSEAPAAAERRRRRCEQKQKRGKRAGINARLAANPFKSPLPTLFLSNVNSIRNKMDEIRLLLTTKKSKLADCCCMIFTESKLDSSTPDAAITLAGHTAYRADRTAASGKKTGGGLCVFVHNSWCTDTTIVTKHCCPDIEFMVLKCRPFFLPREYTVVYICAVYIAPDANSKLALALLQNSIQTVFV